jgi:hypothetical protein
MGVIFGSLDERGFCGDTDYHDARPLNAYTGAAKQCHYSYDSQDEQKLSNTVQCGISYNYKEQHDVCFIPCSTVFLYTPAGGFSFNNHRTYGHRSDIVIASTQQIVYLIPSNKPSSNK